MILHAIDIHVIPEKKFSGGQKKEVLINLFKINRITNDLRLGHGSVSFRTNSIKSILSIVLFLLAIEQYGQNIPA